MTARHGDAQRGGRHPARGRAAVGAGLRYGFSHSDWFGGRALLEAAAESEFPVFEVPYDVPFTQSTEGVHSAVTEQ